MFFSPHYAKNSMYLKTSKKDNKKNTDCHKKNCWGLFRININQLILFPPVKQYPELQPVAGS